MPEKDANGLREKGIALYKQGKLDNALEYFNKSLNLNRFDKMAWYNRANCLLKMGQLREARTSCDMALDSAPFYSKAWFARATAETKLGWQAWVAESLAFCVGSETEEDKQIVEKAKKAMVGLEKKGIEIHDIEAFNFIAKGYSFAADMQDFQKALEQFDIALGIAPKISKIWQFKGMCWSAVQQTEEAVACYSKAINIDGINAAYWYNKALLLAKLENDLEAVSCYEKAIEIFPGYLEAISNLGNLHRINDRFHEAIECLNRAVEISPDAENPWYNKALSEEIVGNSAEAIRSYKRFLELASPANVPQIENARQRISDLSNEFQKSSLGDGNGGQVKSSMPVEDSAALGDKESSEQDGNGRQVKSSMPVEDTAAPGDKESAEKWNRKGIELFNLKSLNEAIACFDKAIEFDPELIMPIFNKAIALDDLGRFEEAIVCYRKVVSIEPGNDKAWHNMAAVLQLIGRFEEALRAIEKALEINNQYGSTWFNKGKILSSLGRQEDAILCYDKALEIDPKDVNALNNKGSCLLEKDKLYDALACYEAVTAIDSQHAFAWNNQGEVLNRLKRFQVAISCFDKAIEIKAFAAPWHGRGESLRNLKQTEEALESYKKALEQYSEFADAWLGRYLCEEKMGHGEDMIESLKQFFVCASMGLDGFSGNQEDIGDARKKLLNAGMSEKDLEDAEAEKKAFLSRPKPKLPQGSGDFIGQKYEIFKILGKGGFGVVYLVYSHEVDTVYALKTFRDEYMKDERTRELFKKEAQILVDMDSYPYLVEDYLIDEISGRIYIAMEYIAPDENGLNTLESYLARKPPDLEQSLRWAIQFCMGMEFIASQGLKCHRDIKPANIMITQQDTIKISDFGLAGILTSVFQIPGIGSSDDMARSGAVDQTVMGESFGTPSHMPPEQFVNAASCDERSDIYSFGVVLYQMVSGGSLPFMAPYPKENTPEEFNRYWQEMHEHHTFTPPPAIIDSPLNSIIAKCLEKDPGKRFQTFSDLRGVLEPLLLDMTGETVRPPEPAEMNAATWLNKGLSLKNLGRIDEAIDCYDKAIDMKPPASTVSLAWSNKGNCFMQKGLLEKGLTCYEEAIKINPANEKAWTNKAFTLHTLGRLQEAIDCYDKALEIEPAFALAWSNKAFTYLSMGDHEKTLICSDTALKYDKGLDSAWINKGAACYAAGRLEEAMTSYLNAIAINPNEATSHYNMGLVLNDMQKYDEAIASYDRALELSPDYASAWCNKGNTYLALKDYDQAMACLDKAEKMEPQYLTPIYYKAYVMLNTKNAAQAVAYFKEFLKKSPPDSTTSAVADAKTWLAKLGA